MQTITDQFVGFNVTWDTKYPGQPNVYAKTQDNGLDKIPDATVRISYATEYGFT